MAEQWDFAAYDRENRMVLVVEVKTNRSVSSDWAARLRRNNLAHGALPNASFFMIVCPDQIFVWKDAPATPDAIAPTLVADAEPIFRPFLDDVGLSADQVSNNILELIVAAWLNSLLISAPEDLDSAQRWVADSGLLDAVAGGHLDQEVRV